MSLDFSSDIKTMHTLYGVHEVIETFDSEKLRALLEFRADFIGEEYDELRSSISGDEVNSEDVVDALIDIVVVALGTLDLFKIDTLQAWNQVLRANMEKRVGIKASRPNPLGLPDLIKPEGWVGPDHSGNYGLIENI